MRRRTQCPLLIVLAGCIVGHPLATPAAHSAEPSRPTGRVLLAQAPPTPPAAPPGGALAACDAIYEIVSTTPGVTVERTEAAAGGPAESRERVGCQLAITGSFEALGGSVGPTERLRERMPALGWQEDLRYAADGPNGTSYALRKGKVMCLVMGSWEGGVESDPGDVPSDAYEVSVTCAPTEEPAQVSPGPDR